MSRSPHSRSSSPRRFVAKDFGAEASDSFDDSGALQEAIDTAKAEGGGVVDLEGGAYYTTKTIELPQTVTLEGHGPEVTTITSAIMTGPIIRHVQTELDIFGYGKRSGIRNMTINGLTISGTFLVPVLVEATDAFGFVMDNVLLQGGMVGFKGRAVDAWLENTVLNNLGIRTCQTAIGLKAEASAPVVAGFGRSFGFTHIRDLKVNLNVPNSIALDLGMDGAEATFSGFDVTGNVYMDVNNTTGVRVAPNAHVYAGVWNFPMDTFGGAGRVAVNVVAGGEWRPTGYVGDGSITHWMDGDFELVQQTKGIVMKSPNGSRWRMGVSNAGATTWTAL